MKERRLLRIDLDGLAVRGGAARKADDPQRVKNQTPTIRPDLAVGFLACVTWPRRDPRTSQGWTPSLQRAQIGTTCFNQYNMAEGPSQGSLMREIYPASARTPIWLGPKFRLITCVPPGVS
ncbi:hypothetical protein GGTG_08701 [Gaeumannomyces tritici R3-111a-1]|uniref:Uncharacterized protein n=1 Tax=Gaeumannomyces tritici (strain R3-111a-1) TaxID=644352 RepID=J3P5B2_GAET3|nr:hypothetical protein GGTG_08701 [Gaeumannomyces tritici R3-111a-1]EJT74863.1 hypothetical protein GGTG_08701 [Gaeumannomyces tritici R3-111a-1]